MIEGDVGKLVGKQIIVFDIDGTLINVSKRLHASMRDIGLDPYKSIHKVSSNLRRRFWKIFLSKKYIDLDEPINETIEYVRKLYSDNYGIILITGRPERLKKETKEQLRKFNIPYHILIMRNDGDMRSDKVYKLEAISKLIEEYELNIVEYHDDDLEVLTSVRSRYPYIKAIYHGRRTEDILRGFTPL